MRPRVAVIEVSRMGALPGRRMAGRSMLGRRLPACAMFVEPGEPRAVGFEHVRFGHRPVVVGR